MPCGWYASHFLNDSSVKWVLDSWTVQLRVEATHRTSYHLNVVFLGFLMYFISTLQWHRCTWNFTADIESPTLSYGHPTDWCNSATLGLPNSSTMVMPVHRNGLTVPLPLHYQGFPEQRLTYIGGRLLGKKDRLQATFPNKTQISSSSLVVARKGK